MPAKRVTVRFTANVEIDLETWRTEYGLVEEIDSDVRKDITNHVRATLDDLVRVSWGLGYLAENIETNYP